jgi:hypothetical protein
MGMVPLKDIQPGMILGNELKDRNGRTLLNAGIEITESHLKTLKMWGISAADIQGAGAEEVVFSSPNEIDPALLQEAESQLRELFCHADLHHPFINELFRLVTLQRVMEESGEKKNGP